MTCKPRTTIVAGLALAGLAFFSQPVAAQQASITLTNCDGKPCYTHDNTWTIDKTVTGNTIADGTGKVTWTVTATKDGSAAATYTIHGGLTVTNTGTAPATIGNIVVNLQKPNSPKKGSNASYVSIAADVADATSGDAATSAKIVAAGSQENVATNAAWGTNNYTVSGAQGTFNESNLCSGKLEFTDASANTIFSLVPQPTIPVGGNVTLLYDATFNVACLPAAGTVLRVETMVTFGNAGARGGSGATGSNIDINGNGTNDADEAKVRTVPCRITMAPLPTQPEETNGSVTVADLGATTTGTVTTSTPTGFDAFPAVVSATTSWDVSVDVDSGADGGKVCNTATLDGTENGGTLNVIVGYVQDEFGNYVLDGLGNKIPVYATYTCAPAATGSKESCVDVGPPTGFLFGDFCTYTQGGYAGPGAPGQFFNANFSGLTIGISDGAGALHNASWTLASPLKTWLGGGGPSGALTADTLNATSTSGGTLAKQVATLSLNVQFSGISPIPGGFGSLVYTNPSDSLDGLTVAQILDVANAALADSVLPSTLPTGYSFGTLNDLITNLNEAFDNCAPKQWAQDHLKS